MEKRRTNCQKENNQNPHFAESFEFKLRDGGGTKAFGIKTGAHEILSFDVYLICFIRSNGLTGDGLLGVKNQGH